MTVASTCLFTSVGLATAASSQWRTIHRFRSHARRSLWKGRKVTSRVDRGKCQLSYPYLRTSLCPPVFTFGSQSKSSLPLPDKLAERRVLLARLLSRTRRPPYLWHFAHDEGIAKAAPCFTSGINGTSKIPFRGHCVVRTAEQASRIQHSVALL